MFQSPFSSEFAFECLSVDGDDRTIGAGEKHLNGGKRARDFQLGREAAERSLRKLSFLDPPPVERGDHGEPIWPDGIVGSITHSHGVAAAVAAPATICRGVGIDIEQIRAERRIDISDRIAFGMERTWLRADPAEKQLRTIMIFSAKESIYKALYPRCRRYFGFSAVQLEWRSDEARFAATLLVKLSDEFIEGFQLFVAYQRVGNFMLTATTVPLT